VPVSARELVPELALVWAPVSVRELAQVSAQVSAQVLVLALVPVLVLALVLVSAQEWERGSERSSYPCHRRR
jgi:hypothetical protein